MTTEKQQPRVIAITESERKADNEDNAKTDYTCVICGKDVKVAKNWLHVVYGGGCALHPEDEDLYAAENDSGDCGCHPIGPACLRKHPELKPYVTVDERPMSDASAQAD